MFETKSGNILKSDVEAIVNTVNCVGIMGKGIALQFKYAYPENYKSYKKACDNKQVKLGKMHIFDTGKFINPRYIINFPTKNHWKGKSKIEEIRRGLFDLKNIIVKYNIRSIAIPPLGCGNGGLDWNNVKNIILESLNNLSNVKILLYAPEGAPKLDTMPVKSKIPNLTKLRALLISLIKKYSEPGYKLSLLEVQKLAYFLQESGEELKLEFVKDKFGPYAEKLNFVLQRLEGHYLRGYGDRSRDAQISVVDDKFENVEMFITNELESKKNLERIYDLIKGFESPYGMELLATVHWVLMHNEININNIDNIIDEVQSWNLRKKKLLKPNHIKVAYNRLKEEEWI